MPGYFNGSVSEHIVVDKLGIQKLKIINTKYFHQIMESNFGRVAFSRKHGFSKENTIDRNTIKSPCKLVIAPCLYAVCISKLMQSRVSSNDIFRNPGTFFEITRIGTTSNDCLKIELDSDFKSFFIENRP